MKRLVLILTLTVTSAAALASPAAAAPRGGDEGYVDPFAWKKCSQKVDFNLKIVAARHMRCKGARRVMARYDGSISRKFQTSGFNCKRVKGKPVSGVWRCKKGRQKAFRFAFGD
jgi:hypothetical protein